jgi:hypothetical protein
MMAAGDLAPELTIKIAGPGDNVVEIPDVPGQEIDGEFRWAGSEEVADSWSVAWQIKGDPDPSLNPVFHITNLTAAPQDFSVTATLPVTPINIATLMGGSVSLTAIDNTLDNGSPPIVESVTSGDAIYIARADGVDVQTLLDAPQSFVGTENGTTAFGPEDFGVPIPSDPGPSQLLSDIEIEINARVSAGDTAVVVATFVVDPVPEPAGISLFGVGAVALAGIGRRCRRRR